MFIVAFKYHSVSNLSFKLTVRGLDCLFEFQTLHDLYWKNTYWKIFFNLWHFSCWMLNSTDLNKSSQSWYLTTAQQFQEILLRHVLAWQSPWSFLCNLKRLFESSLITLSILKTIYWEQCWQVCSLFLLLYVMQSDSDHDVFKWTIYENPTYKELLFVWLFFFCSSMHGYKCIVYCNKYPSFHAVNTMMIFSLILWHLWFVGFLAWPCRLTVLWQNHWFRFFSVFLSI